MNCAAAPTEDAVLFSLTDEPVLAPWGVLRGEPYSHNHGFQTVSSVFEGLPH